MDEATRFLFEAETKCYYIAKPYLNRDYDIMRTGRIELIPIKGEIIISEPLDEAMILKKAIEGSNHHKNLIEKTIDDLKTEYGDSPSGTRYPEIGSILLSPYRFIEYLSALNFPDIFGKRSIDIVSQFQYEFLGLVGKNEVCHNDFHKNLSGEFFNLPLTYNRKKDGSLGQYIMSAKEKGIGKYHKLAEKRKEYGIVHLEEIAGLLIQDEVFTCDRHKDEIDKHIEAFASIFYGLDKTFEKRRTESTQEVLALFNSWIGSIYYSENPLYTLPKETQRIENIASNVAEHMENIFTEVLNEMSLTPAEYFEDDLLRLKPDDDKKPTLH